MGIDFAAMVSAATPDPERARVADADAHVANWRRWGPYLSERGWGSVREDYSATGDAWNYFPFEHARSRAYRWNEDGMAGICDIEQNLCFALGFWNGVDPFVKERAFGLSNQQGNHGEDVKDYWWYLDSTPSHSWMRWRYHYPQRAFPYTELVEENARRGRLDPEFELVDTGIFDAGRYWIIEVDYAKASPEDICIEIRVRNAGPETAEIDVLPTLWFRNTWSWGDDRPTPTIAVVGGALVASAVAVGERVLASDGAPQPLFCNNETNAPRCFGAEATTQFPKDGINDHVTSGSATVNPALLGTKAALRHHLVVAPGATARIRMRLSD